MILLMFRLPLLNAVVVIKQHVVLLTTIMIIGRKYRIDGSKPLIIVILYHILLLLISGVVDVKGIGRHLKDQLLIGKPYLNNNRKKNNKKTQNNNSANGITALGHLILQQNNNESANTNIFQVAVADTVSSFTILPSLIATAIIRWKALGTFDEILYIYLRWFLQNCIFKIHLLRLLTFDVVSSEEKRPQHILLCQL